ncbi:hypothetical protein ACRALDRAFT_2024729 [Sodiomyces alcalophilus JCM 7366]|uniref:uncharacterized protein n=1 Tax=Sodiomyces alcalophilus JCM 7366 TaxID=591952 RepID=UPI0039B4B9CE
MEEHRGKDRLTIVGKCLLIETAYRDEYHELSSTLLVSPSFLTFFPFPYHNFYSFSSSSRSSISFLSYNPITAFLYTPVSSKVQSQLSSASYTHVLTDIPERTESLLYLRSPKPIQATHLAMAPATKSNFKSYEAQARLLRAIIAAHPEVKWNHKEICKFYGSDMTEYALQHRFRTLKRHADVVFQAANDHNMDCRTIPADLPKDQNQIARIFGSSTPDGIQFQFRSIKKDADAMRTAADNGDDPAKALSLGSAFSTPRSKRTASTVPGSGASSRASGAGSRKRTKAHQAAAAASDGDDDEDTFVETPTKRRMIKQETSAASFDGPADAPDRIMTQGRSSLFRSASSARPAIHVDLTEESEQESRSGNQSTQEAQPAFPLGTGRDGKGAGSQRLTTSKPVQKPTVAAPNLNSDFMHELDHAFSNDFVDDAYSFYPTAYDEI